MTFSAVEIACYFIEKAIKAGSPITQMKVQKVVYFAHGYYLAKSKNNSSLIREKFQAWKFGPVVPAIYDTFKRFGSQPISYWPTHLTGSAVVDAAMKGSADLKSALEDTWEITNGIDALNLSAWTHEPGSPWHKHYKPGVPDIEIPNGDIKEYFINFLE